MMQTQITSGAPSKRPSLEYFPRPGGSPQRIALDSLPFTIGRIDTADLQIDSTRVSREHARIEAQKGKYVLHDLGSTNGTYVNGQPIDATELSDGDTILVADFELTFVATAGDRIRRMATQLMTGVQASKCDASGFGDAVDVLRQMHDLLMSNLLSPELQQIVSLPDDRTFAHYVNWEPQPSADSGELKTLSFALPGHPSVRHRELYRTLALESLSAESGSHLMVDVDTWEIELNSDLARHLARLADVLPRGRQLIVCLPADAATDLTNVARFRQGLHDLDLAVCYRDFLGSGSQVTHYGTSPPDYLMLAPAMARGGHRQEHLREKLQSVLDACRVTGCRPIVPAVDGELPMETYCELGFDLAWQPPLPNRTQSRSASEPVACAV